ncbi:penicillin acylase family protein [Dyella sp. LX-66]|uniref:penicillin acylase family protein n=1 Tax=unclassified Dyella TaxID=2634549 RepID=UPI001BE0C1B1|nr:MULTISPECIES: penicillin acylase family protein [unclassified Dyella]MBT2119783.1 penicillin acylase family protein [Dyella sp. LX-1]MBT2142210.1 penicillin acylase family protein [Dyella sp. LX-66]
MPRVRRFRWLRALLLSLLILIAGVLAAGWFLLAGSRAKLDGEVAVQGLGDTTSIARDALGSATIDGKSRDDVTFALGYVHAQERFFPMDLMRRVAAGELAELVGAAAVDTDIEHRRHRLRATAQAALAQLSPEDRHTLELYTAGVNRGLADLRVKPWEYFLLGTQPQPWKPEDSFLVIGAMYLDLNGDGRNQRELSFAQMRSALPSPLVDFLLAPDPEWEAPLSGDLSHPPVIPGADVFNLRDKPVASSSDAAALAALAPALDEPRPGSNNFAVAGRLTESGAAILANDMHLGLRVPDIWFRARLRYADPTAPNGRRDASGVTLPGTPALVAGSNGQVAWGFTNSYGDWLDWVRVLRDPKDAARYQVPDGVDSIETHEETIRIKGAAPRTIKVESTRWGPILAQDTDGTPLALAWIGDLPRAYNLGVMKLERAASVNAALDLAPSMGMPPQNLLAADSAGNIGWTVTGNSIPLRSGVDPLLPADWSKPGTGWQGWATPAQYPRIENPADGRLWTANNRTIDGAALALLGEGGHDLGARAQQIRDGLRTRSSFAPGNLLDIQLDHRALLLVRWQRLLQDTLAGTTDPTLAQLRQLTASWRGRAAADSVDYRLVRAFRDKVHEAVLAPFAEEVTERYKDFTWPRPSHTEAAVWALVRDRPVHLLDARYADWNALLQDAARQVADELGKQPGGLAARTWGEYNRTAIRHPLSRALPSFVGRWLDMPDEPLPGDDNMPRVARPGFGASERLDVMPGHEAGSILELPGGQSDNPLSPYYGAGHEDWVNGRPTPLLPGPDQHVLTLQPAGRG